MNDMTVIEHDPAPKVTLKDDKIVASSRDIAAYFGKRHDHVLRDIRRLVADMPQAAPNFGECPYQAAEGGRFYDAYDLTRTGFTLLAMGFTGPKALKFKIAYIEQFDAMEAELKKPRYPALPNFRDPASAARAWAEQFERADAAQQPPVLHKSTAREFSTHIGTTTKTPKYQ